MAWLILFLLAARAVACALLLLFKDYPKPADRVSRFVGVCLFGWCSYWLYFSSGLF